MGFLKQKNRRSEMLEEICTQAADTRPECYFARKNIRPRLRNPNHELMSYL
jgi:hypothetical protein